MHQHIRIYQYADAWIDSCCIAAWDAMVQWVKGQLRAQGPLTHWMVEGMV